MKNLLDCRQGLAFVAGSVAANTLVGRLLARNSCTKSIKQHIQINAADLIGIDQLGGRSAGRAHSVPGIPAYSE